MIRLVPFIGRISTGVSNMRESHLDRQPQRYKKLSRNRMKQNIKYGHTCVQDTVMRKLLLGFAHTFAFVGIRLAK